jgi:hypothetical protein
MTTIHDWAWARETSPVIAAAIFAIATEARPAGAIWADPTNAEMDRVVEMAERLIRRGIFPEDNDGSYQWGNRSLHFFIDYDAPYEEDEQ